MKGLVDLIAIVVFCLIMMLMFNGCGTTSVMQCDRYVGPEKEECIKSVRWKQERLIDRYDRR